VSAATLAGLVSTALFAISVLPMVWRAARTRDLSSYSLGHLGTTTAGNLVHTVYVVSLPAGPVWLMHALYLVTTGQMLVWKLRHDGRGSDAVSADGRAGASERRRAGGAGAGRS
jgi:hypothetical protein